MTMSIFAIISLDDLCVSIRIFMKFRLVIILTAFLGGLAVMHYKLAGVSLRGSDPIGGVGVVGCNCISLIRFLL